MTFVGALLPSLLSLGLLVVVLAILLALLVVASGEPQPRSAPVRSLRFRRLDGAPHDHARP